MLFCLHRLVFCAHYKSALEFRELLDFQNVPIIHRRYEADQKCCSSPQQFRTRRLRNLPLIIPAIIFWKYPHRLQILQPPAGEQILYLLDWSHLAMHRLPCWLVICTYRWFCLQIFTCNSKHQCYISDGEIYSGAELTS